MDLNTEKQRPQKVEVVNNPDSPTEVKVLNLPLSGSGNVLANIVGGNVGINTMRPSSSTLYNIYLDNILLLQSDGTLVPLPLNSFFMSVNQTQINNILASYKTAYSVLVSGITAATLHYSKQSSNGNATSEVYDLKD